MPYFDDLVTQLSGVREGHHYLPMVTEMVTSF